MTQASIIRMPPGELSVDKTVDIMARAAFGRYGAHSPRIRALAIQIIRAAGIPEKDKLGEIDAIHEWVKSRLRYVNDPLWQEFITQPEHLAFVQRDGDCDDHAVLEAALLGAIGIRSRFVTVAPVAGPMSHVYLQAQIMHYDGTGTPPRISWINLDPIKKDKSAGWAVPHPFRIKVFPISTPDGIGLQSTGSLMTTLAGLAGVLLRFR